MPHLFDPLRLRDLTLASRVLVSPMCQYSSVDGFANDWHFVHLGTRAVGGAALVFTEATAVTAEGRISPDDLGIWRDAHVEPLERIVGFLHGQGAAAGMQLAHAGRKASASAPWKGGRALGAGRGRLASGRTHRRSVLRRLSRSARARALGAAGDRRGVCRRGPPRPRRGLRRRRDPRGARLPCPRVPVAAQQHADRRVRRVVRQPRPPLPRGRRRGAPGVARAAAASSFASRRPTGRPAAGTSSSRWRWPVCCAIAVSTWSTVRAAATSLRRGFRSGPGYQAAFAERIRREAGVATGAVGMITAPAQADHIVRSGQADCVLLARELLRDPYWPLRAARELGYDAPWPPQYVRAGAPGARIR